MNNKILKKSDLPVGTKVYRCVDPTVIGTIIHDNLINTHMVVVEWDNSSVGTYLSNELELYSDLEDEFKVCKDQISIKLDEIAITLNEVLELAENHDIDMTGYKSDGEREFSKLAEIEDIMYKFEQTGWSKSSLSC